MSGRSQRRVVGSFPALVALATALVVPLTSQSAGATTINVSAGQSIQTAINSASNGDTVVVGPGTYFERINFLGKAIEVRSAQGPDVTVIDGQGLGSVVLFDNSETSASILRGFTIQNGTGASIGGGIYMHDASALITENYIINNDAPNGGGGVSVLNASPTFTANVISGNFATGVSGEGGGIRIYNATATFIGNVVSDNFACIGAGISLVFGDNLVDSNVIDGNKQAFCQSFQGRAAGISMGGGGEIRNNLIQGNQASGPGGGVDCCSTASFIGNIVRGNASSETLGGGVVITGGVGAVFANNVITGNYALQGGGGVYLYADSNSPPLVNNTFAGNNPSALGVRSFVADADLYNNVFSGPVVCDNVFTSPLVPHNNQATSYSAACAVSPGNGNISADPQFVNPASNVYRLRQGSPSINAGSNSAPGLQATDIDGSARIREGTVDMGAYEFFVTKQPTNATFDGPGPIGDPRKDLPDVFGTSAAWATTSSSTTQKSFSTGIAPDPGTIGSTGDPAPPGPTRRIPHVM
jgi:hypothetical protein